MNIDNPTPTYLHTYFCTFPLPPPPPIYQPTYLLSKPPTYLFIDITILDEKLQYKKLHHMIKWNGKKKKTNQWG